MNVLEYIGVISGALCVWLAARSSIWNWPVGIVNVLAYAYVFWEVKLYPDMCLQGFYLTLSIYGWLQWGKPHEELPVRWLRWFGHHQVWWEGVGLWLSMGVFFAYWTESSFPFLDSLGFVLSIAATMLLANKIRNTWYIWMVANVLYIGIYIAKGLYPTALLYVLYLLLNIKALRSPSWRVQPVSS